MITLEEAERAVRKLLGEQAYVRARRRISVAMPGGVDRYVGPGWEVGMRGKLWPITVRVPLAFARSLEELVCQTMSAVRAGEQAKEARAQALARMEHRIREEILK